MGVLSLLKPLLLRQTGVATKDAVRHMSGDRTFKILPSTYQWKKCKDLVHFYFLLGAIPLGTMSFLVNIYIGPATITDIPDDYVPKHWEYYEHPITRFLARYIFTSPQQEYEKGLHFHQQEEEKRRLRLLEWDIKRKMRERQDYQAYYYQPVVGKYYREQAEAAEEHNKQRGD